MKSFKCMFPVPTDYRESVLIDIRDQRVLPDFAFFTYLIVTSKCHPVCCDIIVMATDDIAEESHNLLIFPTAHLAN